MLRLHVGDQLRAAPPELAPPAGEGEGRERRRGELRPSAARAPGRRRPGAGRAPESPAGARPASRTPPRQAQPAVVEGDPRTTLRRARARTAPRPHRAPASPLRASHAFAWQRSTAPGQARLGSAGGALRSAPMRGDRAGPGGGRDQRGRGRPSSTSRAAGGRGASLRLPYGRHSTGTTGFDVVDPCERLQVEVPGGLVKHREKQ